MFTLVRMTVHVSENTQLDIFSQFFISPLFLNNEIDNKMIDKPTFLGHENKDL